MLKTTKRILKIPKSCQNVTDLPKEVPNIPAMHITYRNYDKYLFINKNLSYLFPLNKIENNLSKIETENETSYLNRTLGFIHEKEVQDLYVYGQKTLHYVLQIYFGFYDTESILQKCVEYKNYQGASKISYLDGHFGDSLGFQLNSFKIHLDSQKWIKIIEKNQEIPQKNIKNPVSIISTSCSLESIKNFQDESESQGGCESLCDEICFLNLPKDDSETDLTEERNSMINLLEGTKDENVENVKLCLLPQKTSDSDTKNQEFKYDDAQLTSIQLFDTKMEVANDYGGFSNEIIRKTVSSYVESLKPEIINSDTSLIPKLTLPKMNKIYTESSLQTDRFRIEQNVERTEKVVENTDIIEQASQIVEFYCSRPQITENHILMQNVLIKIMQFWLSNNLPVDVLEMILLKNMDRYFNPLSILLFCKNFNNNLGEGMVNDSESKKSEKSFEFLKQLSPKFCLQLCSMVLQNVNKS